MTPILHANMSTQKAFLLLEKQGHFELGTRPIPAPGKDEILVKIKSVALNPADLWIQKFGILYTEYPAVLGLDFSGDVVELGEGVTRFKVGDRVCVHSSASTLFYETDILCRLLGGEFRNNYSGFQEYAVSDAHTAALVSQSSSPIL